MLLLLNCFQCVHDDDDDDDGGGGGGDAVVKDYNAHANVSIVVVIAVAAFSVLFIVDIVSNS